MRMEGLLRDVNYNVQRFPFVSTNFWRISEMIAHTCYPV